MTTDRLQLLVPLDGSEAALRALAHAITLARPHPGASIQLLTVHDAVIPLPDIGVVYSSYEHRSREQEALSRAILRAGEARLEAAGVPHASAILAGPVGTVIAERAAALGCDGIVMGTRGMGAVGNLLLGSVATQVVHAARVPVTLVK